MGPVREQLESVVQRSGSAEMDPTPRFTLQTAEENDDGSIQMLTQNPRRYFYLADVSEAP
jgi:hypothetical protein